jgi:hypothetical protein
MDENNADIKDPETYTTWYFGIDKPYRIRIMEAYKEANVTIVFSGHIHCRRPEQVVEGIRFIKSPATAFSQWDDRWKDGDPTLGFFLCTVSDQDIEVDLVPLNKLSAATGAWGKGGHVKPEDRNYSLAQQD